MALQLEGRFKSKPFGLQKMCLYRCNQQGLLFHESKFEVCAINGLGGDRCQNLTLKGKL